MESNLSVPGTLSNEELARLESQMAREKDIANKLLDGREKLNEDLELSMRRWPWELLQNASDASSGPLIAEFELAEDFVEFRHNGDPFEMTNLIYLIEQTSVRERKSRSMESMPTVGKFGTGFMTTQLLNDVIHLSAVYCKKEDGTGKTARKTYQRFKICLDRSGTTAEEMIARINATKAELRQLDSRQTCPVIPNYEPGARCDTVFRYPLQSDTARLAAKTGLDELPVCLPFVFAFVPDLAEVRVTNGLTGVSQSYTRETVKFKGDTEMAKTKIRSSQEDSEAVVLTSSVGKLTFAVQIVKKSGVWRLVRKPPTLPTIFVDFPLVGSEEWVFPGVVQSHDFEPNEKRSRVLFCHGLHAQPNREILEGLFEAFRKLAEQVWEFRGASSLLLVPAPSGLDVESGWFDDKIRRRIRRLLVDKRIIKNSRGEMVSISELNLVAAETPQLALDYSQALEPVFARSLPRLKLTHFEFLTKVIDEAYELWFGIRRRRLGEFLGQLSNLKTLSELRPVFPGGEPDIIAFLNRLYGYLGGHEDLLHFRIFPNQKGEFRNGLDLHTDANIPEPLKDVLLRLKNDIRSRLARPDLQIVLPRQMTIDKVAALINESLKKSPPNFEVVLMMTALVPDSNTRETVPRSDQMYQLISAVHRVRPLIEISNADPNLWRESDNQLVEWLVEFVEKTGNSQNLQKLLGAVNHIEFLNGIYSQSPMVTSRKIFLSQVGEFKCLKDLEVDRLEADLTEEGFPPGPVKEALLAIHFLIGRRNLKASLLSPAVNTERFVGVVRFFQLKSLVAEINEFLDNDKNIKEPNFRLIFDQLRLLERDFGFAKFEAYNLKKNEMNFTLTDTQTKQEVSNLLFRKTAVQRLRFLNRVSDDQLPHIEALDLQKSLVVQLLQKIPSMTDQEIMGVLTGKPLVHSSNVAAPPVATPEGGQSVLTPRPTPPPTPLGPLPLPRVDEERSVEAEEEEEPPISERVDSLPGRVRPVVPRAPLPRPTEEEISDALKSVRRHLRNKKDYNFSHARGFDSGLILGVRRTQPFELPIVVVPSHGGRFEVTRDDLREALMHQDAELWVTSENSQPERVALGRLMKENGLFHKRIKFG